MPANIIKITDRHVESGKGDMKMDRGKNTIREAMLTTTIALSPKK
jgi:hypothetical protein